jgi:uncharacterized protein (TIGR00369 family)
VNPLPPYARLLGISTRRSEGELHFVMPFADVVLGRPGYVHGGALAGLLEFAAYGALYEALGAQDIEAGGVTIKPINVTIQYMRGAARHDTIATAAVTRLGNRVANVEAHAWQLDRFKPVAAAQMNLLLRRG